MHSLVNVGLSSLSYVPLRSEAYVQIPEKKKILLTWKKSTEEM